MFKKVPRDMEFRGHRGSFLIVTFKITITVFGAIIVGVGVHSHYKSSWLSFNVSPGKLNITEQEAKVFMNNHKAMKREQICQLHNLLINWHWAPPEMERCPDMIMERFFVVVISLAFIISLIGCVLLGSQCVTMDMHCWQVIEVLYHGFFSILLFAAGVVYIHSANKIVAFAKPEKHDNPEIMHGLMTQQKLAAGAFAIMQAVLYGLVAALIGYRVRHD